MSATPDTKKIYIVISQTGTILSRILKALTKNPYNHSSVALREDLHVLWSFGRRHPYNPFWGGFVKESPFFGTVMPGPFFPAYFAKSRNASVSYSVTGQSTSPALA